MLVKDIVTEQWINGPQIDWQHFKANLARLSMMDQWIDVDGPMWLGMAGDSDASVSLFNDLHKPASVTHDPVGLFGLWGNNQAGKYNPMTGNININKNVYPEWNNSPDINFVLAHEFRHRGFHIIRKVSALRDKIPKDLVRGLLDPRQARAGIDSVEHKLIYSMDPFNKGVFKDREEHAHWRKRYFDLAKPVNAWLKTRPLPKGAPEALQAELRQVYGDPKD